MDEGEALQNTAALPVPKKTQRQTNTWPYKVAEEGTKRQIRSERETHTERSDYREQIPTTEETYWHRYTS